MIEQFNVDSKAERDQLNLPHVTIKKYKKETKTKKNASANVIRYKFKIREGSPEGIRSDYGLWKLQNHDPSP